MLVTSLTSAVAFLSCAFSSVMPIQSFGIYAGIIVPVCFLLTITVQPINYFIYERLFMNMCQKKQYEVAPDLTKKAEISFDIDPSPLQEDVVEATDHNYADYQTA